MKKIRFDAIILACVLTVLFVLVFGFAVVDKTDDQSGIITKVIIHNGCVKVIYQDVLYAQSSAQGTTITTKNGETHVYSPSVMTQIIRKPLK